MQPRAVRNPDNRAAPGRALKPAHAENESTLRELLAEVRELLDSYAPTWYTEALSKKIEAALRDND